MALSGIQIYKLLPQTNCKDCGFPTCLAFAMKLAAKQAELDKCPHVSDLQDGFAFASLREAAGEALDSLGWKPGEKEVRLFINELISDNSYVRERAFEGLKKAGDAAVEPLIETLEHENLMLRRQAAEALGMNNTRACIQALLNVFSDPRPEMFRRANYALWLIGEPAVSPLVEKLRDDDPDVRGRAAVVLGQMIHRRRGDPSHRIWLDPSAIDVTDNIRDDINVRVVRSEAMGPLEELLQDEDASVREYASYALKKLRV